MLTASGLPNPNPNLSLDSTQQRRLTAQNQLLASKYKQQSSQPYASQSHSFRGGNAGEYESINYLYNFGHDVEVMHAIQVKHIRQIKTIEDAHRYTAIDKRFRQSLNAAGGAEDDESCTVIPID